jgi:hypothetical protein
MMARERSRYLAVVFVSLLLGASAGSTGVAEQTEEERVKGLA